MTIQGRAGEAARGVWSAGVEIPAARRGYDGGEGVGMTVVGRGRGGGMWLGASGALASRYPWQGAGMTVVVSAGVTVVGAWVWRRWQAQV